MFNGAITSVESVELRTDPESGAIRLSINCEGDFLPHELSLLGPAPAGEKDHTPITIDNHTELTDSEGRKFSVGDYWDSVPADVAVNRTMLGDLIAYRSYLEDDSRSPRRRAALLASVNEAIEAGTRGVRLEDRPVNDLAIKAIDALRKIARGTDYGPGADPNLTTDEIHRLAVSVVDAANEVAAGGAI